MINFLMKLDACKIYIFEFSAIDTSPIDSIRPHQADTGEKGNVKRYIDGIFQWNIQI